MNGHIKGCLIFFIIVLLIIGGAIFGAYSYFLRTTKAIDVAWTDANYDSSIKKSMVTVENYDKLDLASLANGNFESSGSNNVNDSFSNEEISAVLSKTNNSYGPIEDIKVKFLDGNKVEATFKVKEEIFKYFESEPELNKAINQYSFLKGIIVGTPIYIKADLLDAKGKNVEAEIENISVGNIPMTQNVIDESAKVLKPMMDSIISNFNGFNIESLSFEKDKLNFTGQLPATVKGK